MKKNLRSVIALLLIVFNISFLLDNTLLNSWFNSGISVYTDEDDVIYGKQ